MRSKLFIGHVMHLRTAPTRHFFRYPFYCYAIDIDELPELENENLLFGYNRFRPVSIHDRDYLLEGAESIRAKIDGFLRDHGCVERFSRITLVTAARWFNYVFNPVSFYYCHRGDGTLGAVVAEVNNTFSERHVYLIDRLEQARGFLARSRMPKDFYVSPFFGVHGDYEFYFSDLAERLDIRVNLHQNGRLALTARLVGRAVPLTAGALAQALLRYPLEAVMTMPRILAQAARLKWRKGLPVIEKPAPASAMTIRVARPTWTQSLCRSMAMKILERFDHGRLSVELPGGDTCRFGGDDSLRASMRIRDNRFFTRSVFGGDVGFGESYVDGDWEADDLVQTLRLFIRNMHAIDVHQNLLSLLSRLRDRQRHVRRPNSLSGSRENIRDHYDLGNDFFETFLDPTMMYSAAMYEDGDDDLERAQLRKIDSLIEKAGIRPGMHVLEIGSGWGGFACRAAKTRNCRVTTLTLSAEQKKYVEERVKREGLSGRVEVKLLDYRLARGRYDAIVSIEMLEAVGHDQFGEYFETLDRLLKPGGAAAIQVITIPDQKYDLYRRSCDWIQKHIFPGGHLPCLKALSEAMTKHSRFTVDRLDNIGIDYAHTLREWDKRFSANRERLKALGYDDGFQRKWRYYFAYCEAGFSERVLNDLHLTLRRPGEQPISI